MVKNEQSNSLDSFLIGTDEPRAKTGRIVILRTNRLEQLYASQSGIAVGDSSSRFLVVSTENRWRAITCNYRSYKGFLGSYGGLGPYLRSPRKFPAMQILC
jgi:hypothetical protein